MLDGKALLVCVSRPMAAALYKKILSVRPAWHSDDIHTGGKICCSSLGYWSLSRKRDRSHFKHSFVLYMPLSSTGIKMSVWIFAFVFVIGLGILGAHCN
ncbi:MAG: hypothetical protein IJS54_04950 [Desulfovibrio sp.]|nr:hypothetical protein [Desulfovibrio sp.]